MYKRLKLVALTALMACALGAPLQAANLLVNGDFELLTMTNGNALHSTIIGNGSNGLPTATGWSTTGYNFVMVDNPNYLSGTKKSLTGADDYFDGAYTTSNPANSRFVLWGPDIYGSGSTLNGLTNSPTGGNFLAADGAYLNRPIEQTITGLEVGKTYSLSFWWAAAQQYGYSGVTTEAWKVCFGVCSYTFNPSIPDSYAVFDNIAGSQIVSTDERTNQNHGFVPWKYEYFEFTATSSTQTLSLLAYGTPLGQPPFALLDGLQLQAVPEPTTWAMMMIGFGIIGGVMRTRRRPLGGHGVIGPQLV